MGTSASFDHLDEVPDHIMSEKNLVEYKRDVNMNKERKFYVFPVFKGTDDVNSSGHYSTAIIDMVNHNSEWSNADVEMNWIQRCEDSNKDNVDSLVPCWTLYATKPIKEKQQIFINYDPDPTNKLLINFGFVDEFSTNLDEKITFTASEIHKNPIRYVRLEAFTKNLSQEAKEYYFFIGSKGCSWELQKAVLTTIVEYPQEFSGCMTFEDIFDLKFMKIPSKLKEKANKTLKEIILNKIKTIQQYLYELEENNGFLIQSNKMVMAMFKVQIRFLKKFVENKEY